MRALLIVLLFASSAANAAEWVAVTGTKDDDRQVFVDTSSIVSTDETRYSRTDTRKAWMKHVFPTNQRAPSEGKPKFYRLQLMLVYVNCAERKMAMSDTIFRDENGKQVDSISIDAIAARFFDAPPESNGEAVLNFVCEAPLKNEQ